MKKGIPLKTIEIYNRCSCQYVDLIRPRIGFTKYDFHHNYIVLKTVHTYIHVHFYVAESVLYRMDEDSDATDVSFTLQIM